MTAVQVPVGTLVLEAAQQAGLDLNVPCGGQGRCGRCAVVVEEGQVRRRSTLRLAAADLEQGYALACQTVIEGNARVRLLPQAKVERRLTTDRTAADNHIPLAYNPAVDQSLLGVYLELDPPSLDDQTDDWSRLQTALRRTGRVDSATAGLPILRKLGGVLRAADWKVTVILRYGHLVAAFRPRPYSRRPAR